MRSRPISIASPSSYRRTPAIVRRPIWALENRNIDVYVATGRAKDAVAGTDKDAATAVSPAPEPVGAPRASFSRFA